MAILGGGTCDVPSSPPGVYAEWTFIRLSGLKLSRALRLADAVEEPEEEEPEQKGPCKGDNPRDEGYEYDGKGDEEQDGAP